MSKALSLFLLIAVAVVARAQVVVESDLMFRAIQVDGRSITSAVVVVTVTNAGSDSVVFPIDGCVSSSVMEEGECRIWFDWNHAVAESKSPVATRRLAPKESAAISVHVDLPISGQIPPIIVGIRVSPVFANEHGTIHGEFIAAPWVLKEKETEPNQALQTTPITRSGSERTIEFGYPQRGV